MTGKFITAYIEEAACKLAHFSETLGDALEYRAVYADYPGHVVVGRFEEVLIDSERLNGLAIRILSAIPHAGDESPMGGLKGAMKGYSSDEREAVLSAIQALGLVSVRVDPPKGRGRPTTFVKRVR